MQWVTRSGVKFDRSACVWLIRRFIDPEAEVAYLAPDEIPAAEAAGARVFHNYGPPSPGQAPSPDRVNLERLVRDYQLDEAHPALVLFYQSVRAGEQAGWRKTGCENEGLWAIGNGLSVLAQGDDADFVQRMLPVYD